LKIFRCDPIAIHAVWDIICDGIEDALSYSMGEITLQDIYENLYEGVMHLILIVDNDKIIASCISQVIIYKRIKTLRIVTLSGSRMKEWLKDLMDFMVIGAKTVGANYIDAFTRKGISKMLELNGCKTQYIVSVLKVEEN